MILKIILNVYLSLLWKMANMHSHPDLLPTGNTVQLILQHILYSTKQYFGTTKFNIYILKQLWRNEFKCFRFIAASSINRK